MSKTTISINATPEPAPIAIYVVCSIPVTNKTILWEKNVDPILMCFEIRNSMIMIKNIYRVIEYVDLSLSRNEGPSWP